MSEQPDTSAELSAEQRALIALRRMRAKLEALEQARREPIAIIGMSCRFPGGADGPEAFWRILRDGVDTVSEIPAERWDVDAYYDPDPNTPDAKMYTRWGAFIDRVDQFDAAFWGIAPREAVAMDPQHRLFLESAWEALEHAGVPADRLAGSQTGLFVALMNHDYAHLQLLGQENNPYVGPGTSASFVAGRLAYLLDLHGPSVVVDTACSSSLVALHLACQSLRARETDMCLAGASNLMLSPLTTVMTCRLQALSPDGRSKAFDARANGFARGEGVAVVVLKRLSDALAAGDQILGLIRGSAVNQDGRSAGMTAPNGLAQQAVIRRALQSAGVEPAQIGLIEAHGTGTPLGDPIEIDALKEVYGQRAAGGARCGVASVKTNIGHLEAAAGIAGLVKILLAMRHEQIPPHLHLQQLNPLISLEDTPFFIPTAPTPWPRGPQPRLAALSSFGMSGTNAHLIVEEPPAPPAAAAAPAAAPLQLLVLSARGEPALRELAARYERYLAEHPQVPLADICHSAAAGRGHLADRLAVVAGSHAQAAERLRAWRAGAAPAGVAQGAPDETRRPRVAFLFTGQGAQYVGMGRRLYQTQPTFRAALDRCAEILLPLLGADIRPLMFGADEGPTTNDEGPGGVERARGADERRTTNDESPGGADRTTGAAGAPLRPSSSVLGPDAGADRTTGAADGGLRPSSSVGGPALDQTQYTQPALFALEYALAELWRSWGVEPELVLGHSVGEYVAACVAGVFSLEDGLKLIAARGRLMQALPEGGAMAAIGAGQERVAAAIGPQHPALDIAAVNSPAETVISGQRAAVEALAAQFEAEGLKVRRLPVSHAFHSALMEPMLDEFERVAAGVAFAPPRIGLVSNLTGQPIGAEIARAAYWREHIRAPVRFADSLQALGAGGFVCGIEIGPRPTLIGLASASLPEQDALWLPSLRKDHDDWQQLLQSLGALYTLGGPVDWAGFARDYAPGRAVLPSYPWQHRRYWLSTPPAELRGQAPRLEDWLFRLEWQPRPHQPAGATAAGTWLLFADQPDQALAQGLAGRGAHCVLVTPAAGYAALGPARYQLDPASPADYRRLLADLEAAGLPPLRGVAHLWAARAPAPADLDAAAIEQAQTLGFASALHLARALLERAGPAPSLWLLTRGAQPLGQAAPALAQAPLWSLGQTLALEHPGLVAGLIDLDPAGDLPAALLDTLLAPDGEDQLAFRAGQRYAARLVPAPAPAPAQALRLRPDATYLVTNGLRQPELLRWLAGRGARVLATLDTQALPPREQWEQQPQDPLVAAARAAEELGARVVSYQADPADPAALAAALADLAAGHPPLRGVLHTSLPWQIRPLVELEQQQFLETFRAQALGAWHLHQLTRGLELDFFTGFSSVSAVWGSAGLAHYAAAHRFGDALAHYRRALGLPALSINWGPWAGGPPAEGAEALARAGIQSLPPARALDALGALAGAAAAPQITAAAVDWSVLAPLYEARGRHRLFEQIAAPAQPAETQPSAERDALLEKLRQAAPARRRDLLAGYIQGQVAGVLGIDQPQSIDTRQGLFDLGTDSLMAVEIKRRLERGFGHSLSATLVFDYPSIEAIAEHVLRDVLVLERAAEAAAEPDDQAAQAAALAEIHQLSEAELAALVDQELSALLNQ